MALSLARQSPSIMLTRRLVHSIVGRGLPTVSPSFRRQARLPAISSIRSLAGFTFAGPRRLEDILKTDMLNDKSGTEIADIWYTYHYGKEGVIGLTLTGQEGKDVLERAKRCPFFVQPVFRDDGFFMMVSNFQEPSHFLMAYLEDYKMDPQGATPLLTFSVFDDLIDSYDVALVRCDVLNKGIEDGEARKVVQSVLDNYRNQDDFGAVKAFNERPKAFDIDDYISRMNERWKHGPPTVD